MKYQLSVQSNSFKKFKAIESLSILGPYFRFFLLKRFFRKSSKSRHWNLVLITSTVQVELSKFNFNFADDMRTYFLQVLSKGLQTNSFCHSLWILSVKRKKPTPMFLTDNIKINRILTKIFYIVFQVLKVLRRKNCKIQSLDLLFLVAFISRHHFSQYFRTSFNIIWKKDFRHKFSFLNRNYSNPHTSNPLKAKIR